jgi:hypothetical protein
MFTGRVVTKAEFDAFLQAYPRPLERNVMDFFEPPILAFHDFTVGAEWDSIVASITDEPREYRIHDQKVEEVP